jgi:hypothetical protein
VTGIEVSSRAAYPVRQTPRVAVWAVVGGLIVALEIYIAAKWILSGQATTTTTGVDGEPTKYKVMAYVAQVASTALAIAVITYVVRQCRREGRLTFDAVLVMAWVLAYWQDPLTNYFRPLFFYNAAMINFGSWTSAVPGSVTPRGHLLPEPLFLSGATFCWIILTSTMTCWCMREAKRRRPAVGTLGLIGVAYASMIAFDVVVETVFSHAGLYVYAAAVDELSFRGDGRFHFPLYQGLTFGGVMAAVGCLRYFLDDRGRSLVEQGVDGLLITERKRNVVRVLSVTAFVNGAFMVFYTIPTVLIGFHVDKMPDEPTWMRVSICGADTPNDCPGPDVPVYLPGQTRAIH